ncbi:MAG: response regulator, partial [Bdellovibrionales bacterium]|nr:response regulator [Bdellovibrionales bacterium]
RSARQGKAATRSVLVVEDDPYIIEVVREIVQTFGFEVVAAESAGEALSAFEQSGRTLACVILDYNVPGMDASRLLARMRELDADVKVLLSSGYSQAFISREFPLESVHGFIPKPYQPAKLVEALQRLEVIL